MESGEAPQAAEIRSQEKRIDPNHPYRITGPTKIRFGSKQFLAVPSKRPADGGGYEHNLLFYSLNPNGTVETVDGYAEAEWLKPGDTIGRGEDNKVILPEGDLLASRKHAKVTFGIYHQGEGRIKMLLGRAGGPNTWAITDTDSKNGTFVSKVDPRSLPAGIPR